LSTQVGEAGLIIALPAGEGELTVHV
jgi:hypothetical protein